MLNIWPQTGGLFTNRISGHIGTGYKKAGYSVGRTDMRCIPIEKPLVPISSLVE